MDLEAKLADLTSKIKEHRDALATEEAAKTALIMPFLQAMGYNVFDPSEVIPEFTCDIGTKKGEKVDYAICNDGKISILIECKGVNIDLNTNHASQLFRYFSVTDARIAILTNGIVYRFFSDVDTPNKMDEKPFFSFDLQNPRKADYKTLSRFMKGALNIDQILEEASKLKLQSLIYKQLQKEFEEPSEDLIRVIASNIHSGRLTAPVKEMFRGLIISSFKSLVNDAVTERLTSALSASTETTDPDDAEADIASETHTTEEEFAGFNIIRAIVARNIDPERVVMRDSKSYCAILLDDNNRKTIARLHFNSDRKRYLGTFSGKNETKLPVADAVEIYQYTDAILARVEELGGKS